MRAPDEGPTMSQGVRAELAVGGACPLAGLSAEGDAPVSDVTWTRASDGTVTEEFRVPAEAPVDGDEDDLAEATPVMDVGDGRVYQFERDADDACACDVVEDLGVPVSDVRAADGELLVTLHVDSPDRLREVVDELRTVAERVTVRYLVHGATDGDDERTAVVDVGRLTDRQREVVETAVEMGYFEYPRDASATEVADALGIDVSTFAEHLALAQSKLFDGLLSE
jgi:predicted DNA binding protein